DNRRRRQHGAWGRGCRALLLPLSLFLSPSLPIRLAPSASGPAPCDRGATVCVCRAADEDGQKIPGRSVVSVRGASRQCRLRSGPDREGGRHAGPRRRRLPRRGRYPDEARVARRRRRPGLERGRLARARELGRQAGLHFRLRQLCRRPRQRLEVPVPGLRERR
ncbi:hypothetical protein HPB47_027465, partial [Ixodes persulcatus]